MNHMVLWALITPLIGTTLGAAMVFFLKDEIKPKLKKILLGFASGVMIAASVWSLLIPAIEMEETAGNPFAWFPASVGFLLGIAFLLLLYSFVPHLHLDSDKPEDRISNFKKNTMLIFAVTLHNFPEGMAVGVVLAGVLAGSVGMSMAGAMTLAIGIALQNFPEGAVISMPLISNGVTKKKAFLYGFLSGIVEPAGALLTMFLTRLMLPFMPYTLAFAAGAMIYVVVEELIPEAMAGEHSNIGTVGVALGFTLMMILDVALG